MNYVPDQQFHVLYQWIISKCMDVTPKVPRQCSIIIWVIRCLVCSLRMCVRIGEYKQRMKLFVPHLQTCSKLKTLFQCTFPRPLRPRTRSRVSLMFKNRTSFFNSVLAHRHQIPNRIKIAKEPNWAWSRSLRLVRKPTWLQAPSFAVLSFPFSKCFVRYTEALNVCCGKRCRQFTRLKPVLIAQVGVLFIPSFNIIWLKGTKWEGTCLVNRVSQWCWPLRQCLLLRRRPYVHSIKIFLVKQGFQYYCVNWMFSRLFHG